MNHLFALFKHTIQYAIAKGKIIRIFREQVYTAISTLSWHTIV